jgi:hypothetical protein
MFAQGMATFFRWLMGEAPEGQRKLVFGARAEAMLFLALMISLVINVPDKEIINVIVDAMVAFGAITIGGNGIEWVSKAYSGKKGKAE